MAPSSRSKPGSRRGLSGFAIVVLAVCMGMVGQADAHGTLLVPKSRNVQFFESSGSPGAWYATAGNGLGPKTCPAGVQGGLPGFCNPVGQPGVCGDPVQEVSPATNIAAISNYPVQARYTTGQTVRFTVNMQVNHGGRFTFKLCDRREGLNQACFDQRVLLRADNNKPNWYILSGRYGDPPTPVSMDYKLPAGFSCANGCTIQWEYFTYNTCIEPCDAAECGFYAERMNNIIPERGPKALCGPGVPAAEIFRNCADIIITGADGSSSSSGGSTVIQPPVVQPPTASSSSSSSSSGGVGGSCPDGNAACAAWGPSTCNMPGVASQCPCMCSGSSSSSSGGAGGMGGGASGCVDSSAACPAWGPSTCGTPGVATTCPCMCGQAKSG